VADKQIKLNNILEGVHDSIDEKNVLPKIKNVKKRKNVTKIKKTFVNVE